MVNTLAFIPCQGSSDDVVARHDSPVQDFPIYTSRHFLRGGGGHSGQNQCTMCNIHNLCKKFQDLMKYPILNVYEYCQYKVSDMNTLVDSL